MVRSVKNGLIDSPDALTESSDSLPDTSDSVKESSDSLLYTSDSIEQSSEGNFITSDALSDTSDSVFDSSDGFFEVFGVNTRLFDTFRPIPIRLKPAWLRQNRSSFQKQ